MVLLEGGSVVTTRPEMGSRETEVDVMTRDVVDISGGAKVTKIATVELSTSWVVVNGTEASGASVSVAAATASAIDVARESVHSEKGA